MTQPAKSSMGIVRLLLIAVACIVCVIAALAWLLRDQLSACLAISRICDDGYLEESYRSPFLDLSGSDVVSWHGKSVLVGIARLGIDAGESVSVEEEDGYHHVELRDWKYTFFPSRENNTPPSLHPDIDRLAPDLGSWEWGLEVASLHAVEPIRLLTLGSDEAKRHAMLAVYRAMNYANARGMGAYSSDHIKAIIHFGCESKSGEWWAIVDAWNAQGAFMQTILVTAPDTDEQLVALRWLLQTIRYQKIP